MNRAAAKEIVEIFVRRDGMTREDAIEHLREAYSAVQEAIINGDADEVWMAETGLEPNYLYDLMF